MFVGVEVLYQAVSSTLGAGGRHVVIDKDGYQTPHITKDGVTVASSIQLDDPVANMGANIIKEAAQKTAREAGDGTTTSTVLAYHMIKSGMQLVSYGVNPIELSRGMQKMADRIVDAIRELSIPIEGNGNEVDSIATISANNDTQIGQLIATAIKTVGKNGLIRVETDLAMEDSISITKGMQYHKGYISKDFCNNTEKTKVLFEETTVIVLDFKLKTHEQALALLTPIFEDSSMPKNVLIIAHDVQGSALQFINLANNSQGKPLSIAATKAPSIGRRQKDMLLDICAVTGATLQEEPQDSYSTMLYGKAPSVEVTSDTTTIMAPETILPSHRARIQQVEAELATLTGYDEEKYQERLAMLDGAVAIIQVGGGSELEQSERKDRVDDALAATHAAIQEGILAGGGTALARISDYDFSDFIDSLPVAQKEGAFIVLSNITKPMAVIAENAGYVSQDVADMVNALQKDSENPFIGFDAKTGEYVDMIDAGIIDPSKVTRIALQNSVSVAGIFLTIQASVIQSNVNKS